MAAGPGAFIKQNASIGGPLGVGLMATELAGSENKLKSLANIAMMVVGPAFSMMAIKGFGAAKDAAKNLIKETGSLDAALRKIGKAADDAGKAFVVASEEMKAAAGAPWAEREIQNTKNMTRAVEAMTPAVASASSMWENLSGGFSSAKSATIRWAAESGALGDAINFVSTAVATLAIGATALSVKPLTKWLWGASEMLVPMRARMIASAAGTNGFLASLTRFGAGAIRVLGILGKFAVVGVIGGVLLSVAGAIYGYVNRMKEAETAAARIARASRESANAISAEIAGIQTAEDQMRAYANSLDVTADAYKRLLSIKSQGKTGVELEAAQKAYDTAKLMSSRAAGAHPLEGAGSGTEKAQQDARIKRDLERQDFQQRLSAAPLEQQPQMLAEEADRASVRGKTGQDETAARSDTDKKLKDIEAERMDVEKNGTPRRKEIDAEIARLSGLLASANYNIDTQGGRTARKDENFELYPMKEDIEHGLKTLRNLKEKGEGAYNPKEFADRATEARASSLSKSYEAQGKMAQLEASTPVADRGADYEAKRQAFAVQKQAADAAFQEAEAQIKSASALRESARIRSSEVTEAMALVSIEEDLAASRTVGYERAVAESAAMKKKLEVQLAIEKSVNGENTAKARGLKSQIADRGTADTLMQKEHEQNVAASDEALKTSQIQGEGFDEDEKAQENKLDLLNEQLVTEQESEQSDPEKVKALETQRNLQQKTLDSMKSAHSVANAEYFAEYKKSNIEGVGYNAKKQAFSADIDAADTESDRAGTFEQRQAARNKARNLRKEEAEFDVSSFQKGRGIRSELEQSSARVRGDSAAITAGVNFDEFKGKMDSLRGTVDTQKAAEIAGTLSRDAITLRARNDMNSSNAGVVGASMARIGGGGGIGPGATSMIDISKQIKDLSIEANRYLAEMLALEKKKGGIP